MAKMFNGIVLREQILKFVRHYITKPQKKIGGMAICPFAKQYLSDIEVIVVEDYAKHIDTVCQLIHPLHVEAVVIGGPMQDYDEMYSMVARFNKRYHKRDIEILLMHPDTEEPPLPLNYNFKHSPLVIVQKRSTLQKARNILEKSGRYYKYYK